MNQTDPMITYYDDEAEATGWYGPEIAFGLAYKYIQPGQTILDLGIGTGLASVLFRKAGLVVNGMDISPQMLEACRNKGLSSLKLHDLSSIPFPYDSESMDHVVCTGVLNFFSDLSAIFQEAGRILRCGGLFIFVVGDRAENENHEIIVGPEHTKSDETVNMYLHSHRQVTEWMEMYNLSLLRDLSFLFFMDRERTRSIKAKVYLSRKSIK